MDKLSQTLNYSLHLLEVGFGYIGAISHLAEMADADVAFKAHDDSAIDTGHHGDLDDGQEPRQDGGEHGARVNSNVHVRHGVEHGAADYHNLQNSHFYQRAAEKE
jgi:hypothetical protein